MTVADLVKSTLLCGIVAYFVYSYPVLGQIAIIGLLFLLWLSCAAQVVGRFKRRQGADLH